MSKIDSVTASTFFSTISTTENVYTYMRNNHVILTPDLHLTIPDKFMSTRNTHYACIFIY